MKEKIDLNKISLEARKKILRMATNGGCFIGAAFSCVDVLTYLYFRFLKINKDNYKEQDRDYFFLSKGHAVPALYAVLSEKGMIDSNRLDNHLSINDDIYWHPNRNIPGVEFHSGSLGHNLPIAVGVAADIKIRKLSNKVFVLTGDGELNEGSNWEALLIAKAYNLDNLIVIVDRNMLQANVQTENLIPLEPLEKKFTAFGCTVSITNGHNFKELENTFSILKFNSGKPNVVIANTIRGKGIASIESRTDKWFCNFTNEEYELLLKELEINALL